MNLITIVPINLDKVTKTKSIGIGQSCGFQVNFQKLLTCKLPLFIFFLAYKHISPT